jgi:predicted small secreted protein
MKIFNFLKKKKISKITPSKFVEKTISKEPNLEHSFIKAPKEKIQETSNKKSKFKYKFFMIIKRYYSPY